MLEPRAVELRCLQVQWFRCPLGRWCGGGSPNGDWYLSATSAFVVRDFRLAEGLPMGSGFPLPVCSVALDAPRLLACMLKARAAVWTQVRSAPYVAVTCSSGASGVMKFDLKKFLRTGR